MNAPRPDHDPRFGPGGIDRDIVDPTRPYDPRMRTDISPSPRGLAAATVAVALVLLVLIAFSFVSGGESQQAETNGGAPAIEQTDDTATSSIAAPEGAEQEIPPIKENAAEPAEPAPAE